MKVQLNQNIVDLPDCLLVGAAKSGTTFIARCLEQHSRISIPVKEPRFFCFNDKKYDQLAKFDPDLNEYTVITSIASYLRLYEDISPDQAIIDASVWYLYLHTDTIANIKKYYGEKYNEVKILLVLRNPVDRLISHYTFNKNRGIEDDSLLDVIMEDVPSIKRGTFFDYIGWGMYFNQVKMYLDNFDCVKVVLYDDLNDGDLMKDILIYLNLNQNEDIFLGYKINASGEERSKILRNILLKQTILGKIKRAVMPKIFWPFISEMKYRLNQALLKKTTVDIVTKRKIQSIYKEDILKLQALIGRDLSIWLD